MIEIKAGYIVELIDSKYLVHKCIVNYDNENRLCFTSKANENVIGGFVKDIRSANTPYGEKLFIGNYKIIKILGRAPITYINMTMYSDTREILWSDVASIEERKAAASELIY